MDGHNAESGGCQVLRQCSKGVNFSGDNTDQVDSVPGSEMNGYFWLQISSYARGLDRIHLFCAILPCCRGEHKTDSVQRTRAVLSLQFDTSHVRNTYQLGRCSPQILPLTLLTNELSANYHLGRCSAPATNLSEIQLAVCYCLSLQVASMVVLSLKIRWFFHRRANAPGAARFDLDV